MIYLLHQAVLYWAEVTPEKEAFVCGRDRLTYREAATKIRQFAGVLTRLGVQRGDRVGVFLNRSIETAIAMHGIMLAGAAYVPLDPKASAERIHFQVEDCGIRTVVTNAAQKSKWARSAGSLEPGPQVQGKGLKSIVGLPEPVDGLETISWPEVYQQSAVYTPDFSTVETDLAYIMYTSGSTGQPKGIMHTHASGLAFARLAVATHGLTANDIFGNHAPIYFDVSTLAYFAAPLVGATAVIATDGHTIFAASLSKLMAEERITVWYSVPLALTQMLQSQTLDKVDLSALRHVFYAGEPFAPKYIRQWRATVPHAKLTNWYGPAETNVCTYHNIEEDPVGDEHVPIGKTWGNTEYLLVRRDDLKVVEPGVGLKAEATGQLLIRSATTMAGYWNRPDLTEAAFYDHPNPSGLPHRFYRTGDLVRLDESGNFHFLGRADNQVKVRGYRVELDAIEARLLAHPTVVEAVVLAMPGNDGTLTLRGFCTTTTDITSRELRTFAGETLAWYAVPETIDFRKGFPRTGSGKISRPALRDSLKNENAS